MRLYEFATGQASPLGSKKPKKDAVKQIEELMTEDDEIKEMDMNADVLDWFDQTCRACGFGKYHATQDQETVKCNQCGHDSKRFVQNTNKLGPKKVGGTTGVGMSQSKRAKALGLF